MNNNYRKNTIETCPILINTLKCVEWSMDVKIQDVNGSLKFRVCELE